MLIGIFDSGMGGLSVLAEAKIKFPNIDFIYYGDSSYAPYGTKTKEAVISRSITICDLLVKEGVSGIIVACNTATSAAIKDLRANYDVPIIGMEPALKPALCDYKGGDIIVMATPMTLQEEKFNDLLLSYKKNETIYKIPTPNLVDLVEDGIVKGEIVDNALSFYFKEFNLKKVESVVLGCTHFLFLKRSIQKYFGNQVHLIDGHEGTLMQLSRKLNIPQISNFNNFNQKIKILNSMGETYISRSWHLLENYEVSNGN